ncbi:hypothetical protein [Acinetobacter sp. YH16044]|uniref:hypothetical protein n=1 Tax=Acinetobacter sp. YH16044 TaxID=2601187 RepID=UPI0015D39933|nr:hypothetical protein [Acinetobacter sp. YH16044]
MAAWQIWLSFDGSRYFNNYLDKKLNTAPRKHSPIIHNSKFHEELQSSYSKNSTLGVVVFITLVGTLFLLSHTEKTAQANAFNYMEKNHLIWFR